MDSLNKTLNNLSLYEVKAYVRKAQNAVLSLTEMEAKVREATNNEPWGAPSSLMQQIAAGTYNYREREEIINMIFRRFTEKSAHEWRQIYKALQLLEYIIKNGSEKFVDDARANVSIIQMLKSFHYIDSQGRDQGVNVRNRAKQLISLLNDESMIRQERKKARQNQKKFGGVAGGKSSVNPNSRYTSTFEDDEEGEDVDIGSSYGGYQNRVFGDGGVYGERYEEERPAGTGNDQYEEYEVAPPRSSRTSKPTTTTSSVNATATKKQDVDLFAFDAPSKNNGTNNATSTATATVDDDDDDFDDFQSAAPTVQSTPVPSTLNASSLAGLFNAPSANTTTFAPTFNSTQGAYQQHLPTQTYSSTQPLPGSFPSQPSYNISNQGSSVASTLPSKPKADAFSSLFTSAKTLNTSRSASTTSKPVTQNNNNNDNIFAAPTTTVPSANDNNRPNSKDEEIDLLSF